MRNLFIHLTCIVLFALSTTTVTANAKFYNQEENTGGYVVIVPLVNFDGEYEVAANLTELMQETIGSNMKAMGSTSMKKTDSSMIVVSALPISGGKEIVLSEARYHPGIVLTVNDLVDIYTGNELVGGDEYALIITQGGKLVDRFEFTAS